MTICEAPDDQDDDDDDDDDDIFYDGMGIDEIDDEQEVN